MVRDIWLITVQVLVTAAVVLMVLLILSKFSSAQDSSKYKGGSYDGSASNDISLTGLNGSPTDLSKYKGGGYDGFVVSNISLIGLNGQVVDITKYLGGSYDGFASNGTLEIGLNGQQADITKYRGGNYDGFSIFSLSLTGLNGQQIDVTKFLGGSFDGFSLNNISLTGLNGQTIDLVKYLGGSYDGFAFNTISLTGLNGQVTDLTKYKGGSYDGFAISGTQLIPLNGGNMKLKLTALIEGFYNPGLNKMIKDTARVYIRIVSSPYTFVDSAKVVLDSLGQVNIDFYNAPTGTYYIVIKHRNSIETWSRNGGVALSSGGVLNIYDFTVSQSQAYGNNLVLKGTRYCIYSGNPNQDDVIDGTDLALIDNDASNFTKGYVSTDVNGDEVVDGSDLSITDNNASNFISVIRPPGADNRIIIKKHN